MAELEVAKHAKNAINSFQKKEHSLFDKVKEFLFEIFIIVFAVTLSIWLHGWSEKSHQDHEAKDFLLGLKNDLIHDKEKIKEDIAFIKKQEKAYQYISMLKQGELANNDSVATYQPYFYKHIGIKQNNGRYEGFKSSGKFGFIEDAVLENDLLDLYEEIYPSNSKNLDIYNDHKNTVSDYIIDNTNDFPNGSYITVLSSNPIKNRCRIFLMDTQNVISSYESSLKKIDVIIKQIDKKNNL